MTQVFSFIGYYGAALAVFLADRITKQLALAYTIHPYEVTDFLSFELIINRGVSWSMFHSDNSLVFGLVTAVVIGISASAGLFCLPSVY